MRTVKCVVVGDSSSGRTSLVISYTNGTPSRDDVTAVFEAYSANLMVDDRPISLGISVTDCREAYARFRAILYPQTDVFLICFSIVNPSSFNNVLQKWFPEVSLHCPGAPIILVGTKQDLRNDKDIVDKLKEQKLEPISHFRGQTMANTIGAVEYFECSAMTQMGVHGVFETTVRTVLRAQQRKRRSETTCKCKCSVL